MMCLANRAHPAMRPANNSEPRRLSGACAPARGGDSVPLDQADTGGAKLEPDFGVSLAGSPECCSRLMRS
jgi:hypothetical protein